MKNVLPRSKSFAFYVICRTWYFTAHHQRQLCSAICCILFLDPNDSEA